MSASIGVPSPHVHTHTVAHSLQHTPGPLPAVDRLKDVGTMVQSRTGKRGGLVVAASAAIVGFLASGAHAAPTVTEGTCGGGNDSTITTPTNRNHKEETVLSIFAREAFDRSNRVAVGPTRVTEILAGEILAGKVAVPAGLEHAVITALDDDRTEQVLEVQVAPVIDYVSSRVLKEVRQLCSSSSSTSPSEVTCDPNVTDPVFGTTPLHLAEVWGSRDLVDYLLSIGANPELYDSAGRQPRDMAYSDFTANSKKAGAARFPEGSHSDDRCEIPEVVIPLFPDVAIDKTLRTAEEVAVVKEWRTASNAALSEVRRLFSEGVPIMTRNVVPWLLADSRELEDGDGISTLQYPDAATFSKTWGDITVDVGSVSYEKNFQASTQQMTLKEYDVTAAAAAAAAKETTSGKRYSPAPDFVFQRDTEVVGEGLELLGKFVEAALPSSGHNPIVCPAPSGLLGLQSMRHYRGGPWSGNPHHMHSDALNMVVAGRKRWYWVKPRLAMWTRRHIQEYTGENKGRPWKDFAALQEDGSMDGDADQLMECVQRSGDVMYIAGGWGHTSMFIDDATFGYTLGLINQRDTLSSIVGAGCEQ